MNIAAVDSLRDVTCAECDYPLRGLDVDRCPECGAPFDRATLVLAPMVWEQRGEIGGVRAYFRTLWQIFFRGSELRTFVARPMDYAHARLFWFVTCIAASLLSLPVWVIGAVLLQTILEPEYSWILFAASVIATPPALLAGSGVGSYFCYSRALPRESQDRAIAMWYYQSPLICWYFAVPLFIALAVHFGASSASSAGAAALVFGAIASGIGGWVWSRTGKLYRAAGRSAVGAFLLSALAVTLMAFVGAFVWLSIVGTVFGGIVMYHSLYARSGG